MNLQPYPHRAPRHLGYVDTPLGRLDYRLRLVGEDLMIDAANMLKVIAGERDAADARNKILEAEFAAMRADRDRLSTKVQNIARLTDPQVWAENSRNRTQVMAELFDGRSADA